jgi:heme exporter protein B
MLMLQAGALILGFLLITLEIRHLFHGSAFKSAPFGFAEAGTLALLWGGLALGTWRLAQRRGEARLRWIAYGLALAAALLTVGVTWGLANPFLSPVVIRGWPILNSALSVFGIGFPLFSAMAANTRLAELLLPVLALPFFVPIVMGAAQVTARLLSGRPASEAMAWLRLLAGFDLVFLVACALAFPFTIEE